ncbi:NAD(P)/FAD-dependent oxidoreductase [Ktedonosporobacter rubrisoli]|uniref:NAD(P)/FAD-dependent oxidoreductase n=1 Tax=Ktedonosporobacter rubrisoli TaxID=2509675 RepID=A0A4V0YZ51_KTERU|nr:NAD(P)/FAD-dependent oxidoreductase [Ktedonosporobacter rubrisoli]QBD78501.1 NAD(P)/FAD-dependent oxidoreductase [Ktedonosporobacter rubrisoli]
MSTSHTKAVEQFDAVIVGAGPGGEVAAIRLRGQGLRVALIERELIGGECGYWACVPSKTLLRVTTAVSEVRHIAGLKPPPIDWGAVSGYRDYMVRDFDDRQQVQEYEQKGITFIRGEAHLKGPGRLEVAKRIVETPHIIIATGSQPRIPAIEGLEQAGYWTNRQATAFTQVPESVVILGGSAQSVELGQMFRRFGAAVTLIERGSYLLRREEPELGTLLADYLREDGVVVELKKEAVRVEVEADGTRVVHLNDGTQARGRHIIVATGRAPRTYFLGLEEAGVEVTEHGIRVDEYCRAAPGIWAVGDVTGIAKFTHVAQYQARVAADDILGKPHPAKYNAVPRVVFSDPEIGAVGLTAEQARTQGLEVVTAAVDFARTLARPSTYGKNINGRLGLIADKKRGVLVGAWGIGPEAGEWIHLPVQAIHAATPVSTLRDMIVQFPTFSESFFYALQQLDV